MSTPAPPASGGPVASHFALTPRQRRLRQFSWIILAVIGAMIALYFWHPFFHPVVRPDMTRQMRQALGVQILLIWSYFAVIFLLLFSVIVIAWLYAREVRLQLVAAQRDMVRDMVEQARKRDSNKEPPEDGPGPE